MYEGAFHAKFLGLLNPFALLAGVVSLSMLLMHGAAWLGLKAEGGRGARAAHRLHHGDGAVAWRASPWPACGWPSGSRAMPSLGEYVTDGPSNPLHSRWTNRQAGLPPMPRRPWIVIAPILGFLGGAMAIRGLRVGREVGTLLWSKLGIFGVISTVGLTMFPFILPSSSDPQSRSRSGTASART
jgi:cytochrome d ubiquinol oxidase subunit II